MKTERDRLGSLTINQLKIRAHCTAIHQALHHHDNNTQLQRLMVCSTEMRKRYPFCILESNQKCNTFDSLASLPVRCHEQKNELHAGDQTNPKISCKVKLLLRDDSRIRHTYQNSVESISGLVNCRQASVFQALAALLLCVIKHSRLCFASVCFCGNSFPQPFVCLPVCCKCVCVL